MAIWAPLADSRIRASLSNCGCILFRESLSRDTGLQAEFVVPDVLNPFDIDDVLASHGCPTLVLARSDDRWSRGASELRNRFSDPGSHLDVRIEDGGHAFPTLARQSAYAFLDSNLKRD